MMVDWWFWIGGLVHLDWLMVDRCIWIGSSGFGCYVWGFVGDFFKMGLLGFVGFWFDLN